MAERRLTRKQKQAYEGFLAYLREVGYAEGDQIESLPAVAERLGVSLTLLKRILPVLREAEVIDVVPRLGTFVRTPPRDLSATAPSRPSEAGAAASPPPASPLPTTRTPSTGTQRMVRLYPGRPDLAEAAAWRGVVDAFEAETPGMRVQMVMTPRGRGALAGPEVLILPFEEARSRAGEFRDWTMQTSSARFRPAGLDGPVALVSRFSAETTADLAARPPGLRDWIARAEGAGSEGWGVALADPAALLCGLPRGDEAVPALRPLLELLATVPPPLLVTPTDVVGGDLLAACAEGNPLVVIGSFAIVTAPGRDAANRTAIPLGPETGAPAPGLEPLAVCVAREAEEPAESLARFVVSLPGQRALGASGRYLPAHPDGAEGHPLRPLAETYPSPPALVGIDPAELPPAFERNGARAILNDVRSLRLSPDEAAKLLLGSF